MKIRSGFVSNSSSSSFIIAFDEKELTPDYLKDLLYQGKSETCDMWYPDQIYDVQQLCSMIVDELTLSDLDSDEVYEIMSGISEWDDKDFPTSPGWDEDRNVREKAWGDYEIAHRVVVAKKLNDFAHHIKDMYIFCGTFADDYKASAQIEHGPTFNAVPHIKVSNH